MNITYTISRYEFIEKSKFLVGFRISDDFENIAYLETVLATAEISGKTQQEVCQLAYENLKPKIQELKEKFALQQGSIEGYQFHPIE